MTRNMAGYSTLPGLRAQELAIAIDAGPIPVDEGHGIAANRTIRWRTLGKKWEKIRQLVIVFVHDSLPFPLFYFELKGFFRTLAARHADKRQLAIDNRRGHGTDRMAIGQLLSVFRRNIHFPIGKTVLHFELLPQALGRWTGAAAG